MCKTVANFPRPGRARFRAGRRAVAGRPGRRRARGRGHRRALRGRVRALLAARERELPGPQTLVDRFDSEPYCDFSAK